MFSLFFLRPTWESAKKLMADVNFIKKLTEFNKENISDITLRKIKTYIEHKDFDPIVSLSVIENFGV